MFWLSFIHPHVCGFARVAAWQIAKQVDGDIKRQNDETSTTHLVRQKDERFRRYCEMFQGNENFSIDKSHFTKMLRNLRLKFRDRNPRLIEQRNHYVQVFAVENWTELTMEKQSDHKLEGCGACMLSFSHVQALFPVKSKQFVGLTKRTPLAVTEDVVYNQTTYTCTPSGKCSQQQAVQTALNIYNEINPSFQKTCNMSLAKAFTKSPELQLDVKKTKSAKRKKRRDAYRKAKQAVESAWEETSVIRLVYIQYTHTHTHIHTCIHICIHT